VTATLILLEISCLLTQAKTGLLSALVACAVLSFSHLSFVVE
jgi:hypothetical protein